VSVEVIPDKAPRARTTRPKHRDKAEGKVVPIGARRHQERPAPKVTSWLVEMAQGTESQGVRQEEEDLKAPLKAEKGRFAVEPTKEAEKGRMAAEPTKEVQLMEQTLVEREASDGDGCRGDEDEMRSASPTGRRKQPPTAEEMAAALAASSGQEMRVEDIRKLAMLERSIIEVQISVLSASAFKEDSMLELRRGEGWCLVVCHQGAMLNGYLVYRRFGPPLRMLVVLRLAVRPQLRRRGHGRRLMEWIYSYARQAPASECNKVCLSALPGAVDFYARLGFAQGKQVQGVQGKDDDGLEQSRAEQVWMERRVDRTQPQRQRSRSRARSGSEI